MYRVVAHRGASITAPDNTLAAYRLAADVGAEMIELDIRRSADAQIVVYHDVSIHLPGEGEQAIARLPLDTLLEIPLDSGEHIPRFEDVLTLCDERGMGIYIEFKDFTERLALDVLDCVREAGMLKHCILFGARPDHVFFIKQAEPQAQTCFSYRQAGIDPTLIAKVCRADGLNLAWEDYPDPLAWLTPEWFAPVRAAGLRLMSWHEEREPLLRGLIAAGIEDLCTNDPALARRLVDEAATT